MTTDDRTETIHDRAAIRASDEPSERGDFPCCSGARAAGDSVGAPDLEAMHETICDKFTGMAEVRQAADALVAEVRSLRVKLAAVEATVDDLALRGAPGHDDGRPGAEHRYGIRVAVARLRAALATGEGK